MKVLVAQLDVIVGALQNNVKKIVETLDRARMEKCDLVVFPEMTICGYPPEDLILQHRFVDEVEGCLSQIVAASKSLMVVVGLVRRNLEMGEKAIFNSAAVIQNGMLVGFHDKWLLPTYDVFDEWRYFESGKNLRVWEWCGKKIAVLVCEDMWQHAGYVGYVQYHRDPVVELQNFAPDLLVNISASPYQYQKAAVRVKVCQKAARTLRCPVILCGQVGGNDQLVFDGYSVYVGRDGRLHKLAQGFAEDWLAIDLTVALPELDVEFDDIGDLYRALVLGTRDYFYKQGFAKGLLGLSGGIDSAVVACIAADALGKENVRALGMPSRFSSSGSIEDSKLLAYNLGILYETISIETIFTQYLDILQPTFVDKPWDTTEENLQARIRGNLLMALSNKFGYLVLSTGNKSEMAMGYCTLYGDMAGGLAVIADVLKMQVYELAHWINRQNPIIPMQILEKAPSAELKANQTDQDSLPNYEVVDAVLRGYVEEFLAPEEIAMKYGVALTVVQDLIGRIHKAEYKRRQAAPSIRVSKKSFGVGRRYPIVHRWHPTATL